MTVPFRIGVMQLTMEPLDEMLESARVMDEAGMDTVWLAEAYPWWRKHEMEARSSTVVSALMARETERLTIGWGIISPFTRHPVQVAMDARVVQEAAGPGRFILGFGTSKIFLNNARMQTKKTLGPMRDAVEIVRGVLGGERVRVRGRHVERRPCRRSRDEAHTPREVPPVYVAATAPKMQALAGEIADGLPDAVDHDARVRPLHARERRPPTSTSAARSSPRSTRTATRAATAPARSPACTSRTRCRTSRAPPTRCSTSPGSTQDEIRPVAEAMERGGRLAAKAEVTDAILDKCKPIAGTPGRLHRRDRGVPRRRLHARHARAVGRQAARPDPALRREGAAAFPRLSASSPTPAGGSRGYEPREAQERALERKRDRAISRSHDERARDGVIPGSVHVPRSVLEWRVDPDSGWSNPRRRRTTERRADPRLSRGRTRRSLAARRCGASAAGGSRTSVGGFDAWRAVTGSETIAGSAAERRGSPAWEGLDR